MIPIELQDALEEKMQEVFEYFRLKNPVYDPEDVESEKYVPLNIYKQDLPEKSSDDLSLYPYLVIKLIDGSQNAEENPHQVRVLFVIGVYDDDDKYQGYKWMMTALQKVYTELQRSPVVGNRFQLVYPINWSVHDEDLFPFFFGGLETNWEIPRVKREDVEAMI